MQYLNKKILITGGLGFIGSTLARRLVKRGAEVIVVDNLDVNCGGNYYNVHDVLNKITFRELDITHENSFKNLLNEGVDIVFHLAAQTSHMGSMLNPVWDLEINAKVTLQLLEAVKQLNPNSRVVYSSTRQIYGKTNYLPVDEVHPIHPIDINGIHKYCSEQYLNLYYKLYNIPMVILRLTNVYGPGLRIKDSKQMFMGGWIRNILEDKPFEVWGGQQVRDLVYVEDVVEALLLAGMNEHALGHTFNVGGETPCSLLELAQVLIESAGKGSYEIMEYPPERKGIEIGNIYLDNTKIKNYLNWNPKIDLKQGLQTTMAYYKKNFKEYV